MNVYFQIILDENRSLDEFELSGLTDSQLYELGQKEAFEGILTLAYEGNPYINISDELEPWIQNLCFASIPKILSGEPYEILYFSKRGFIRLDTEDTSVRLSGDRVPVAHFPAGALAVALFACGNRFVDWARKVKDFDSAYLANIDCVEEYRPSALEALQAAGLALHDHD